MEIELKSPEQLFSDPDMIAMAKGIIPLPDTSLKWTCPRCHWQFCFSKRTIAFECPICSMREINIEYGIPELR